MSNLIFITHTRLAGKVDHIQVQEKNWAVRGVLENMLAEDDYGTAMNRVLLKVFDANYR